MINLIPTEAKKYVRMEYWLRTVSMWFLLLTFAVGIIGALLIPSVVLIRSQLVVSNNNYQAISAQNEKYTTLEKKVRISNNLSQKLLAWKDVPSFTSYITLIEGQAQKTIRIKSLVSSRVDGLNVEEITVVGIADSRQALVSFRDTLEAQNIFESVELPLSNLAKDKDVPFNIIVKVKVPKK